MNAISKETTFTAAETAETRTAVRDIMAGEGLNQKDIARDSGIAYGTFTGWLAGTYQGNNDKVTGEVQIWLSSREEKKRAAAQIPAPPEFQPTPSAMAFIETLRFAQVMPEIVVISGAPGIGKTRAIQHYQASNRNVWIATMDPTTSKVNGMQVELCEELGLLEKAPAKLARAIGRKVEGTGGLIVIDEAQHLDAKSLDQLRSFYDRYNIGVALVGNELVYRLIDGERQRANFAQLVSRIGMRITQTKPKAADMCRLIEAWGVTDKEEVKLLKAIAAKPGALRSMTKVLQLASMMAAGAGELRGIRHIRDAYQRLTTSAAA